MILATRTLFFFPQWIICVKELVISRTVTIYRLNGSEKDPNQDFRIRHLRYHF